MGPSFRYHVATIVAVFLALAVGMVIGSSHLQEALVDRLRVQLRELSDRFTNEIQPLRKENESKGKALALLTARVTRGALTDKRVAVAVTGDYGDAAQQAAEALRQAGATIESTTVFPSSFPVRLEIGLPTLAKSLRGQYSPSDDNRAVVFRTIASLIARGAPSQILTNLTEAHLIQADGGYGHRADAVVLIGGSRDESDRRWLSVDQPLIEQLSEMDATVIGTEPESSVQSYIRAYQSKNISTVDNVDTEIGRTCLVLLVGGERGAYGVKNTARDGLLPLGPPHE